MPTEAKELVEQVTKEAPRKFLRVKAMRTYAIGAWVVIFALIYAFQSYLPTMAGQCILFALVVAASLALGLWLRVTWQCPVCSESPGSVLSDPRYCTQCGARLEEEKETNRQVPK